MQKQNKFKFFSKFLLKNVKNKMLKICIQKIKKKLVLAKIPDLGIGQNLLFSYSYKKYPHPRNYGSFKN